MTARLFEVEPDRDVVTAIISQHQWKGYTKDGQFRCKAGCVIPLETPELWRMEARHQADMLLSVYTETEKT